MKIKKYTGTTMPEIMNKIKNDLGSDAVILNSKEIKEGGIFGLFKRKKIEVVAALDPEPLPKTKKRPKKVLTEKKDHQQKSNKHAKELDPILLEIKHLKKIVSQQSIHEKDYAVDYQTIYNYLLEQEVEADLAGDLIESVQENHEDPKKSPSSEQILQQIQQEIEKRLFKISFKKSKQHPKQIIHFMGPTGVGKTTTLAKIAAKKMLEKQKKVAMITMDTYRIAAIDQLKTYAEILKVPLEVAYSQEEYMKAIEKLATYDYILVDTAGRNFRKQKYFKDLPFHHAKNVTNYLVLSLTAKPKDIIEIYEQFSQYPIHELIFTKVDETTQYGSLLNIALNYKINISYLTNGQDVPDDLIPSTPEKITEYVLGGYFND